KVVFSVWLGRRTCPDPKVSARDDTVMVAMDGWGTADLGLWETVAVGGLAYIAHYVGDDTYKPSDSACEPLGGDQLDSSSSTVIHLGSDDTGGTTVAGASEPIGTDVHDSANVTGTPAGGIPTGNVVFSVRLGERRGGEEPAAPPPADTETVARGGAGDGEPAQPAAATC